MCAPRATTNSRVLPHGKKGSTVTDCIDQPNPPEEQSFQFSLRDMLQVTLVAALFFGLLGSAPAGILVATAGTISCGTWILLRRRAERFSGTRDYIDLLKFAVLTFLLECLLGWTTGFLGLFEIGMVLLFPLAITRLMAMPIAGLNWFGALWRIRRKPHGLVHAATWFAVILGFAPFVGVPAMYAGHLHRLYAFEGHQLAVECLQLIHGDNPQPDPLPPTIARMDPLEIDISADCVVIDDWTSGYTFEKLDSSGNWALRCWRFTPTEIRTVATIHEDEFR